MPDSQINPTAAALLGLLHEGPMTGGQLMAAAERRLGPYWSMTRSQVYRELPVLADMGYVRLGKPGPRSSQPYAITALNDVIWYVESNTKPNMLARFAPRTEPFQTWTIPAGGGVVRNMMPTRDGGLALAESGVNKVALATIR